LTIFKYQIIADWLKRFLPHPGNSWQGIVSGLLVYNFVYNFVTVLYYG